MNELICVVCALIEFIHYLFIHYVATKSLVLKNAIKLIEVNFLYIIGYLNRLKHTNNVPV